MARRFRRSKRPARRHRKGRKGYKTNNNLRSLNPIAQRYICKLKYAETVQTDANGRFVFNLNAINDPNRTGAGHQPYGHDQLATLYNRYRVISAAYRILAPSTSAVIQLAAVPSNVVLTLNNVAEAKEQPRGRYMTSVPGGQVVPVTGKVYMPSLTGRTKTQYMSDDRYQAEFGSAPLELMVLNLMTTNFADATLASQYLNVEIVYTVECFDINNLVQS